MDEMKKWKEAKVLEKGYFDDRGCKLQEEQKEGEQNKEITRGGILT